MDTRRRTRHTRYDVSTIKRIPIPSIFGQPDKNNNYKCLWHDDSHASMKYYPASNTVHCFVCNCTHDFLDIHMKLTGMSFIESCRTLSASKLDDTASKLYITRNADIVNKNIAEIEKFIDLIETEKAINYVISHIAIAGELAPYCLYRALMVVEADINIALGVDYISQAQIAKILRRRGV